MGKAAIEIQGVTKYFGEEMILKNITHTFESEKIHGIVGMNGSGKTVLLKCICGFLHPSEGKILVEGKWIGKETDFPESVGQGKFKNPGIFTGKDREKRNKRSNGKSRTGFFFQKTGEKLLSWNAGASWDCTGDHGRPAYYHSGRTV
mgnify:CR=1 FL=1